MVDFDKPLTEVLDVWLGASGLSHKIRLIFKVCDIKTYLMFHIMDKDSVAAWESIVAQAPTKLREIHAIRINKILAFIRFLETIYILVADNPMLWKIEDFRKWKRDGKPTNVTSTTPTLPPAGSTVTAVQTKQQKTNVDIFMGWKETRKDTKDYPVLNEDKFYTEWFTQVI